MASLAAIAKSYRAKRDGVSKLRRQREKKLKEALSEMRRSNSGLVSLERKKEDIVRQRDHAAQSLNQYLAQKDSIERLKVAAEERLRHEQDARDEAKQQSEYGGDEEKVSASQRLKIIDEKIAELRAEIREREGAEARILGQIENSQKAKSKLDRKLKSQSQAKPGLLERLKSGEKAEASLRPHVQSLIKREAQTSRILQSMVKKLAIIQAAKRKAARKHVARRAKLKSKLRRLARKKNRSRRMKSLKRRVARKIKTRTRKAKRKVAKIKARRSSGSKRQR